MVLVLPLHARLAYESYLSLLGYIVSDQPIKINKILFTLEFLSFSTIFLISTYALSGLVQSISIFSSVILGGVLSIFNDN